eukprot:TRINITY_DN5085_c0_g1_i2.p1 TRINITY_DN5085_c0_g1~~TRINITY_DN5085_c0_g1_i2.p1  ORF type:complete len:187 (-),score=44.05 TRINITY_DN5085_c0_g1_i2:139-699(-)
MPQNFGAKMEDDVQSVLFDAQTLQNKCAELGAAISKDYDDKVPLLVGVLSGAAVFMADLVRCVNIPAEIDFISVSSYGKEAKSSGELRFRKDLDSDLTGRHVIIVEDIVDTGNTLKNVTANFASRGAASVKLCTLLDKKARRSADVELHYVGFDCPDEFVIGYGIDYAERYRTLPYVAALKRSVYE